MTMTPRATIDALRAIAGSSKTTDDEMEFLHSAADLLATVAAERDAAQSERDAANARAEAAENEAYELKYAAAGGEDVAGSAAMVTVADVNRWRIEQSQMLDAAAARAEAAMTALRDIEPIVIYWFNQGWIDGQSGGEVINTISTALAPQQAKADGERVRHKKRGSTYRVLHRDVELQASVDIIEGHRMVVYKCEKDGKLWVRWEEEFDDGRFEPLADTPSTGLPSTVINNNQT